MLTQDYRPGTVCESLSVTKNRCCGCGPGGSISAKVTIPDKCQEPCFNKETILTIHIPLITEIQRFSVQDGPGIRTTLFVKGCPLRCPWCHNPETQSPALELFYRANRCTHCLKCVAVCLEEASSFVVKQGDQTLVNFDRGLCSGCMNCVPGCLSGARQIVGQQLTMDDILGELIADKLFFDSSGGGVTISGGEPLMFAEFTSNLCAALKDRGVHVAIETGACVEGKALVDLIDKVDLFIVDLKTLDPDKHKKIIGGSLTLVLNNIAEVVARSAAIRIHIPVIPGFNDSPEDYQRYAQYLGERAPYLEGVDILPYHCYGEPKYSALGRSIVPGYKPGRDMQPKKIMPLVDLLKAKGVTGLTIGGIVGVSKGNRSSGQEHL